ncbi:MAG: HEAT repeat domain-containing protein [Planctomycetes bacterium]|nr:HEAT repeat domain-containing protein [Planctomycetota bacterium]
MRVPETTTGRLIATVLVSLGLVAASPAGDTPHAQCGGASAFAEGSSDARRDVQRALSTKDVRERTNALDAALRGADSAEAADAVIELVFATETPQMVLDVGVRALGRMTSVAAQEAVGRALERPIRVRRVLIAEALGRSSEASARIRLTALARNPDVRVRAAAVTALAEHRSPAALDEFAAALDDPEWTVRSAAVRGIALIGEPKSAPLLVARLRKEDGRLLDDLSDALATLTGKRYGPDADAYDRLSGKSDAKSDGKSDAKSDAKLGAQVPPPTFTTGLFETRSRRILFVLSVAETMKDPVHRAGSEGAVVAGVAKAGADLADLLIDAKTKMDVARTHLRGMLRTLGDGVEFDVMTYAGSPTFAFGQFTRADDAARRKAESRIARLTAGGPPDLYDAFERILDPRAKDPLDVADGPDTVVLVTDGALPSQGMNDRTEIGPREARWNRARQIRYIVVAVGQAEPGPIGYLAGGPPAGITVSVP